MIRPRRSGEPPGAPLAEHGGGPMYLSLRRAQSRHRAAAALKTATQRMHRQPHPGAIGSVVERPFIRVPTTADRELCSDVA